MLTGMPVFDKTEEIQQIINDRDASNNFRSRGELIDYKENEPAVEEGIIAVSSATRDIFALASRIGNFNATVLILGESGVGKEEVATHIHKNSFFKDGPFITINCGAIPENILESELFGYERGAFTGASNTGKIGLLEAANKGTVFLDEIGEISLEFQVKLLRVLETKEITRVGAVKSKKIDVRIIAATNRNLEKMVEEGKFREDLYYRLNVVRINVPPLRKRKPDIEPLARLFLRRFNNKYGQSKVLTPQIIKEFEKYTWRGNIREMKNLIESLVIVSDNDYLMVEDLPWNSTDDQNIRRKQIDFAMQNDLSSLDNALDQLEKQLLIKAKEKYRTTRAIAESLNVNQSTIVRKLKKYCI